MQHRCRSLESALGFQLKHADRSALGTLFLSALGSAPKAEKTLPDGNSARLSLSLMLCALILEGRSMRA